jgi:hypothetical protein
VIVDLRCRFAQRDVQAGSGRDEQLTIAIPVFLLRLCGRRVLRYSASSSPSMPGTASGGPTFQLGTLSPVRFWCSSR